MFYSINPQGKNMDISFVHDHIKRLWNRYEFVMPLYKEAHFKLHLKSF